MRAKPSKRFLREWGACLFGLLIFMCGFALTRITVGNYRQAKPVLQGQALTTLAKEQVTNFVARFSGTGTKEQRLSWKTEFGQFAPTTEAERELEKMLQGKDENIDLALANWLIAADISEFADFTAEGYFKQLDGMTERVRQAMARMQNNGSLHVNANDPNVRLGRFCNAIIRLGFAYREEFREENLTSAQTKALYDDPDNVFLSGLLRTRRGSCVSMPLIYLVIGQRLGMPVHLVTAGKHYFIRWAEPGYRMNIEPTIVEKASVTPDDSVYLEIEGMTRDQLSGNQMRNLTSKEVVGELFYTRSAYWATKGPSAKTHQCMDLFRARQLSPDDPHIKATYDTVFNFYSITPTDPTIEIRPKEKKDNSI